jgi:crotonobetainyl-CoA:carnitine CoA-transferase CaiB-like acyl-CoA transferase
MLEGVRVVDFTTDIAGPYCTKVLADAGADVVKVEPPTGDPLRSWGSGALFEFLNTSKRSINGSAGELVAAADLLVTGEPVDLDALWTVNRALVVVTITPFGCEGPWADRPSTEFTLQAACGSTGQRGLPEQPPLSAGGRIGEWVTGTYAALGAVAAYREARRCGRGEHVDVAMLDCMAVTMVTYPSVFASFAGWPEQHGTGRVIEVPSVEPSKDGYFNVTTNSAQQFQDFLLMIGRPDLLEDPDLPSAAKRFARRDEFLAAVLEHTSQRTTAELLDEASLFRIPAGPVLNGSTMPEFEQFVARGVFEPNQSALPDFGDLAPAVRAGALMRRAHRHRRLVDVGPRLRRGRGRYPVASPPERRQGHRLHGVVGRTGGGRRPVGLGRRRHQGGVGHASGLHAVRQRTPAVRRTVVGMGCPVPRSQRRQARHHPRPDAAGRRRRVRKAR